MEKSNSLTPTKVNARIEDTDLPESLSEVLSQRQLRKLKALTYEKKRQDRVQKAMDLIQAIENGDLQV